MIHAIISFFIALLSGLGIGSGGLLVIYLTLFLDVAQLTAQGVNLWFFLFSSAAALAVHIRKRKMFWNIILIMSLSGLAGTLLGSFLANTISQGLLRRIFGGMLVLSGLLVLAKNKEKSENHKKIH